MSESEFSIDEITGEILQHDGFIRFVIAKSLYALVERLANTESLLVNTNAQLAIKDAEVASLSTENRKLGDKLYQSDNDKRMLGKWNEEASKTIDSLRGSWRSEKEAHEETKKETAPLHEAIAEKDAEIERLKKAIEIAHGILQRMPGTIEDVSEERYRVWDGINESYAALNVALNPAIDDSSAVPSVTPEPAPKFKKGDKVIDIMGDIGTVMNVDGLRVLVKFDKPVFNDVFVHENYFEASEEPAKTPESRKFTGLVYGIKPLLAKNDAMATFWIGGYVELFVAFPRTWMQFRDPIRNSELETQEITVTAKEDYSKGERQWIVESVE